MSDAKDLANRLLQPGQNRENRPPLPAGNSSGSSRVPTGGSVLKGSLNPSDFWSAAIREKKRREEEEFESSFDDSAMEESISLEERESLFTTMNTPRTVRSLLPETKTVTVVVSPKKANVKTNGVNSTTNQVVTSTSSPSPAMQPKEPSPTVLEYLQNKELTPVKEPEEPSSAVLESLQDNEKVQLQQKESSPGMKRITSPTTATSDMHATNTMDDGSKRRRFTREIKDGEEPDSGYSSFDQSDSVSDSGYSLFSEQVSTTTTPITTPRQDPNPPVSEKQRMNTINNTNSNTRSRRSVGRNLATEATKNVPTIEPLQMDKSQEKNVPTVEPLQMDKSQEKNGSFVDESFSYHDSESSFDSQSGQSLFSDRSVMPTPQASGKISSAGARNVMLQNPSGHSLFSDQVTPIPTARQASKLPASEKQPVNTINNTNSNTRASRPIGRNLAKEGKKNVPTIEPLQTDKSKEKDGTSVDESVSRHDIESSFDSQSGQSLFSDLSVMPTSGKISSAGARNSVLQNPYGRQSITGDSSFNDESSFADSSINSHTGQSLFSDTSKSSRGSRRVQTGKAKSSSVASGHSFDESDSVSDSGHSLFSDQVTPISTSRHAPKLPVSEKHQVNTINNTNMDTRARRSVGRNLAKEGKKKAPTIEPLQMDKNGTPIYKSASYHDIESSFDSKSGQSLFSDLSDMFTPQTSGNISSAGAKNSVLQNPSGRQSIAGDSSFDGDSSFADSSIDSHTGQSLFSDTSKSHQSRRVRNPSGRQNITGDSSFNDESSFADSSINSHTGQSLFSDTSKSHQSRSVQNAYGRQSAAGGSSFNDESSFADSSTGSRTGQSLFSDASKPSRESRSVQNSSARQSTAGGSSFNGESSFADSSIDSHAGQSLFSDASKPSHENQNVQTGKASNADANFNMGPGGADDDYPEFKPVGAVANAEMPMTPRPKRKREELWHVEDSIMAPPAARVPPNSKAASTFMFEQIKTPKVNGRALRKRVTPVDYARNERVVYGHTDTESKIPTIVGVIRNTAPDPSTVVPTPTNHGIPKLTSMETWDVDKDEATFKTISVPHPEWRPIRDGNPRTLIADSFGCVTGWIKLMSAGVQKFNPDMEQSKVFFVTKGQVVLRIGNGQSMITEGGSFIVPRGNAFKLKNPHNRRPSQLAFVAMIGDHLPSSEYM